MSQQLAEIAGQLEIGSFHGGPRGPCIQLTVPFGRDYAQLDRLQVVMLISILDSWQKELKMREKK